MTGAMWVATVAWLCLVAGVTQRANSSRHVPLMLSGMALDVALVSYLQVTKDAVRTALEITLSPLQQLHIGCSAAALVLYVPVTILGAQKLSGSGTPKTLKLHRLVGLTAIAFRTAGFLLMFSMWRAS